MAIDICKRVGRNISSLRLAKGWSQQMLADSSELSREHIVRIENGQKEMGLRTLEKIAKALEISAPDLLR